MDRRPGIIGLLGDAAWFFCKENDISRSKAALWDVRQSSEKKPLGRRIGPDFCEVSLNGEPQKDIAALSLP
jgi:hypothetical protein